LKPGVYSIEGTKNKQQKPRAKPWRKNDENQENKNT